MGIFLRFVGPFLFKYGNVFLWEQLWRVCLIIRHILFQGTWAALLVFISFWYLLSFCHIEEPSGPQFSCNYVMILLCIHYFHVFGCFLWSELPPNLEWTYLLSLPVGKTSLITRFMYDSFDNTYQVRLGPDPEPKRSENIETYLEKFIAWYDDWLWSICEELSLYKLYYHWVEDIFYKQCH